MNLSRLLASGHRNLSVLLGTTSRRFIRWRYADIKIFLNFDKEWQGAAVHFLKKIIAQRGISSARQRPCAKIIGFGPRKSFGLSKPTANRSRFMKHGAKTKRPSGSHGKLLNCEPLRKKMAWRPSPSSIAPTPSRVPSSRR